MGHAGTRRGRVVASIVRSLARADVVPARAAEELAVEDAQALPREFARPLRQRRALHIVRPQKPCFFDDAPRPPPSARAAR